MNTIKFLLITSLLTTIACTKNGKNAFLRAQDPDTTVTTPAAEPEEQNQVGENNDSENASEENNTSVFQPISEGKQAFEEFSSHRNWFLGDFGLSGESHKEDYQVGNILLFDIQWTGRTRKLLADRLGYERSEMTRELANSICEPKIEIGKERLYLGGDSDNLIAELDTDLGHCGINGNEPAAVSVRTFVKTTIGHQYKVKVSYQMRKYKGMTDKSYKDLVVRFGRELEKFDPIFDEWKTVELDMIAVSKFSKLVLRDNGLPNSYGILIDNLEVIDNGPVENYEACEQAFVKNSRGFKKCVVGEVDTDLACEFNENAIIKGSKNNGVDSIRRNTSNIFNQEGIQNGQINFFSLGLKGKISMSCSIDGQAGLFDIAEKTLSLQEVSWNNVSVASYPELAKIRVRLQDCYEEDLNKTISIGNVQTAEAFEYTFDSETYAGCRLSKLIIKDITPNGPSKDGFDFNSFNFN